MGGAPHLAEFRPDERADLPRAPGGRRAVRPARPPPRPRRRRARPAVARRRPGPGAPAARRDAAGAADAAGLARPPLVRRAARRLSRPRHVPRGVRAARGLPRRAVGAHGRRAGADRARRLLDGLGDELRARARPGAPRAGGILAFSGFVPIVDGWQPDLASRQALRAFIAHGRARPGDGGRLRPPRARAARGGRARGRVPRVRRRPPHRPRARARRRSRGSARRWGDRTRALPTQSSGGSPAWPTAACTA